MVGDRPSAGDVRTGGWEQLARSEESRARTRVLLRAAKSPRPRGRGGWEREAQLEEARARRGVLRLAAERATSLRRGGAFEDFRCEATTLSARPKADVCDGDAHARVMADGSSDPDFRQFIRDITRRHERVLQSQLTRFDELTHEIIDMRDEQRDMHDEQRDMRDEQHAQTQALLRWIDRMDEGDGPAA